ncbi:MAG: imidazole glycerol phosphate synthase subunit HisF [Bacteroidetes bacterium]|nr:MAG: imidazole glycerol phosphate synthase subunit HisF [Bacteroidota bacterium]RLD94842.1 MAG: imidazole glycerol phosphate synthase subunit HisF [Bacteroidota bacterium]
MLAKRIIPCLDIRDGKTVKGINFENVIDVGDPVELGAKYASDGADELVYLDITATLEGRKLFADLVRRISEHLNIPFTVGGGIDRVEDADLLLSAGADKVSINSSAVRDPGLVDRIAGGFGKQFVVVAIDAQWKDDRWTVFINGGRIPTNRDLFSWAREVQDRGAGEILFTSMNHDGTRSGYACEALRELSQQLTIPVIASGGAGSKEHFVEVFEYGLADAALAASIFHYNEIPVPELKDYLKKANITIR